MPDRSVPRRISAGVLVGATAAVLTLGACGGSDAFDGSSSSSASGGSTSAGASIVVGAQGFTEAAVMQQMYVLLLQEAGFKVEVKTAERPVLTAALRSGEVDVVPDYLGSTLTFVAKQQDPTLTGVISTSDVQESVAKFNQIGKSLGIGVLPPAHAADQNAFYVTKKFAAANGNLTTLSQLGALGRKVTLGADTFCGAPTQLYCAKGLRDRYGLDLTLKDSYQFGSVKLRDDVKRGVVDMGETGTTDGTLAANGLVVLTDDKKLQPAENLAPFYNLKDASNPKIAAALNKLAPVLTTADLTQLNAQVDTERRKPADVAKDYLTSKKLLG